MINRFWLLVGGTWMDGLSVVMERICCNIAIVWVISRPVGPIQQVTGQTMNDVNVVMEKDKWGFRFFQQHPLVHTPSRYPPHRSQTFCSPFAGKINCRAVFCPYDWTMIGSIGQVQTTCRFIFEGHRMNSKINMSCHRLLRGTKKSLSRMAVGNPNEAHYNERYIPRCTKQVLSPTKRPPLQSWNQNAILVPSTRLHRSHGLHCDCKSNNRTWIPISDLHLPKSTPIWL